MAEGRRVSSVELWGLEHPPTSQTTNRETI